MKIKLPVKVTNLRSGSEYTKDYSKRVEFTEATLQIVDNELRITGSITVREELPFGAIYTIAVDTDTDRRVSEPASDSDFAPQVG